MHGVPKPQTLPKEVWIIPPTAATIPRPAQKIPTVAVSMSSTGSALMFIRVRLRLSIAAVPAVGQDEDYRVYRAPERRKPGRPAGAGRTGEFFLGDRIARQGHGAGQATKIARKIDLLGSSEGGRRW